MPDTNAASTSVDFSDAPGGELDLDALFGNPEVTPTTATTPVSAPETKPDNVVDTEPFLKTATGTVYKTAEDAAKGVEHKDQLIAQLRQQLEDRTGSDPLRKNQHTVNPNEPVNYLQDKDRYFKDLSDAVESKNQDKYLDVQRKFIYDTLAPLSPALTTMVRTQAASAVETEIKDFREFQKSDDYSKTLDSFPLLKQAIAVAESSPEASGQLPEFYKMAYYAHQGVKLPEIVQSQRQTTQTAVRPTVSSTPVAPPVATSAQVQPNLNTAAGRKAIIEQQERAGVENLKF